jgi:hypothetical protein
MRSPEPDRNRDACRAAGIRRPTPRARARRERFPGFAGLATRRPCSGSLADGSSSGASRKPCSGPQSISTGTRPSARSALR